MNPPRLLAIGPGKQFASYKIVLENIITHLVEKYDIHYFAWDGADATVNQPWQVHANPINDDYLGKKGLPLMLARLRPSLVLMLHDFWFYGLHQATFAQHPQIKTVVYCPIENRLVKPDPIAPLAEPDAVVCYTRFGQIELQRNFEELALSPRPHVTTIPHGTDTNSFYPITSDKHQQRRIAQQQLFGSCLATDEEAFIVLNANSPYPRKRLDLTIRGFEQFARGKPANVKLYLHAPIKPSRCNPQTGYALMRLQREGRYLNTPNVFGGQTTLSQPQLNLLYNSCAIGINTAGAEGWGMISFEHAATGAAQIIPDHTNCAEIWQNVGVGVPAVKTVNSKILNIQKCYLSAEGVAAALEKLYANKQALIDYSDLAYQHATHPRFQWSAIARQWDLLFQPLLRDNLSKRGNGARDIPAFV